MGLIHPTAIVEDGARLGADVTVGAFSVVGCDVVQPSDLGDGAAKDLGTAKDFGAAKDLGDAVNRGAGGQDMGIEPTGVGDTAKPPSGCGFADAAAPTGLFALAMLAVALLTRRRKPNIKFSP